jgi:hypothetical protein
MLNFSPDLYTAQMHWISFNITMNASSKSKHFFIIKHKNKFAFLVETKHSDANRKTHSPQWVSYVTHLNTF